MTKALARLDATARDKELIGSRWVNRHTGNVATITKVVRIQSASNPIAELTYDEPKSEMDKAPARWDNDHLLRHWTPIINNEEE